MQKYFLRYCNPIANRDEAGSLLSVRGLQQAERGSSSVYTGFLTGNQGYDTLKPAVRNILSPVIKAQAGTSQPLFTGSPPPYRGFGTTPYPLRNRLQGLRNLLQQKSHYMMQWLSLFREI
jgi:hypothetical protein